MKVIFLDFDGVLNHHGWYAAFHDQHGRSPEFGDDVDHEHLDPACVERLNRIVRETGAEIVVSSTWRILHSRGHLARMLGKAGLADRRWIIDVTPRLHNTPRGDEIDVWLREHPGVESFVILDDDSDMSMHIGRLVQTPFACGLTDETADLAIAMLRGGAVRVAA